MAAAATLLLVGCGSGGQEPAGPLPSARYAIPSNTAATSNPVVPLTSTATPSTVPSDSSATARQGFSQGLDDYCTSFYTGQVHAEDSFPQPDLLSVVRFDRAAALSARKTERALALLVAPPRLAQAYAEFVALTHKISVARVSMARSLASTGAEGAAGADFDEAIIARRPLAVELGAPGCDGRLPPAQRRAAVAALEAFETTESASAACADLATPGFLQTRFFDLEDPLGGCIASRELDTRGGLPTGIKVSDVTGSDGIAATVHYSLIGGCGCLGSGETVARLHFVDGQWLVASFGS